MTDFHSLNLAEPLMRALEESGYTTPTPIQVQAIPHALEGRDLLGIAQTGTGKTAAFALPLLHRLNADRKPTPRHSSRVLVLAPTRELANQIAESFRTYGANMRLTVQVVFGGVSVNKQIRFMEKGCDVLVATPGRLLDLIDQKAMTLSKVEALVLDEADQMLDLGFIHALKRIAQMVPAERQTLFFSATMPNSIADLAGRYLKNPAKVSVAPQATTAERVDQRMHFVKQADKQAMLNLTLRAHEDRVLVFTRTKHGADRVVKNLDRAGIKSAAIHGNKRQNERERVLDAFRAGSLKVLVATDIAARGVDVPGVGLVVNYEIPNVPEQYVHRIGRTARAGAEGVALSFVADDERPYIRDIEKVTRQKIPVFALPEAFAEEASRLAAQRGSEPPEERREDSRGGRGQQGRPGGGRGNAGGGGRGRGAKPEGARQPGAPARGPKVEANRQPGAPSRGPGAGPGGEASPKRRRRPRAATA